MARDKAVSDSSRADLGSKSTVVSVVGIIFGIILIIVLAVVFSIGSDSTDSGTQTPTCSSNLYYYRGSCYRFKTYVGSSGSCAGGVISSGGYCYLDYCSDYQYANSCYRYKIIERTWAATASVLEVVPLNRPRVTAILPSAELQ